MKPMTLPQFLTEAQIAEAIRLHETHGDRAVDPIRTQVSR